MKITDPTKKEEVVHVVNTLINVDEEAMIYWQNHLKTLTATFLRDDLANCKETRLQVLAANEDLQEFFTALQNLI